MHHYFDMRQERSFWFRGRRRILQSLAARYCSEAKTFLEVGCGPGYVLAGLREVLPDACLVASEIYLHGLPYAAKRVGPPAEFIQADCLALPYDREFDAVGAFDVLEHIDGDTNALLEIRRVLKPGGVVLLTVPQHPWLWSRVDEVDHHKRRYRRHELTHRLRDCGYTILRDTSFMFFLLPVMWGYRALSDRNREHYPDAEYNLPKPIDDLFACLLNIERKAIEFGVRFPVGGSRLVVARGP